MTQQYMRHRHDLLGSGWVHVEHGMNCHGLEGHRHPAGPSVRADRAGEWLTGRINSSNLAESRRIWRLIGKDHFDEKTRNYVPIDWQLDFKSGYRWSEGSWYLDVAGTQAARADIKVPWELGRMQHLVQLAWAYGLAKAGQGDFLPSAAYANEFRNQLLDFIATNPPRFGVQWASTMDVAIRVCNWLIAYDLFRAYGAAFDEPFAQVFARSIYEHAQHIVGNLEWAVRLRHNHYLANIVGLLFAGAYLPASSETNTWLTFAIDELIHEVRSQFHDEGTNFEGSVCYHRLSAEMVVYATALVRGLPAERLRAVRAVSLGTAIRRMGLDACLIRLYRCSVRGGDRLPKSAPPVSEPSVFPFWYFERLERMAEFTMHVTKPNGHVAQIGDNDNGRFLKVMPACQRLSVREAKAAHANLKDWHGMSDDDTYWMEDHLDHHHLVGAVNGLFERKDFAAFCEGDCLDTLLIQALARGAQLNSSWSNGGQATSQKVAVGTEKEMRLLEDRLRQSSRHNIDGTLFDLSHLATKVEPLVNKLVTYAYPAFGVYVFQSPRLFLAVRCGPAGRNGQGGHNHNDQLNIELSVDGIDWVTDPGTYVYSALPEFRNRYRSVKAHFAPLMHDAEPAPLDRSLFALPDNTKAEVIYFGRDGFAGMHRGYGAQCYRVIRLGSQQINVVDYVPCENGMDGESIQVFDRPPVPTTVAFSPGYGILRGERVDSD